MTARPAPQTIPAHAAAPADGGGDRARAMLERQLEILGELAEDGLQMSKAIQRQAIRQADAAASDEAAAPPPRADLSRSYVRVARAVRLALMLQAKLIHDMKDGAAAVAPQGPGRKNSVLRIVKRAAEEQLTDDNKVERLVREAAERLDREDICADLLSRPTGEIIAYICQELGLKPDWPELAQEAWDEAERNADPKRKSEPRTVTFRWLDTAPAPPTPQSASP
jgi:hypothetical protein